MTEPFDNSENPEMVAPGGGRSVLVGQILKTGLFALILFLLARLIVLPYEVDGRSMSPNLIDTERVLVNRAVYTHFDLKRWSDWIPFSASSEEDWYPFHGPEPGDVLVLNPPTISDEPFIKRVVAVAGDTISIHDGYVYVNGKHQTEPYIRGPITECESELYCTDFVVPPGTVFVLGDNRQDSFDSRSFGPVPLGNVIGRAWFTNWPLNRIGRIGA
jgi:signal peptidase I